MKKALITFCVLFLSAHVFGQNQHVTDSLIQIINSAKTDTDKIIRTDDLSWHYRESRITEAISLAKQSLEMSQKINYKFGISKSYILLGVYNTMQGNFDSAEYYYQLCKIIKQQLHDSLGISSILNNIGNINLYKGDFNKALDYFFQSLRIEEKFGDKQRIAETYVNIGDVYFGMKNYDKALENYFKYMEINNGLGNTFSIPEVYVNVGNAYEVKEQFDKSLKYFNEGLAICRETGNKDMEAACLSGIGSALVHDEKFEQAIENFKNAIRLEEVIQNPEGLTNTLNQYGNALFQMKKYDEAIGVLYRSVSVSRKIGLKKNIANAYSVLAASYEKKNDFQNAYATMHYYSLYTDSVLNEDNSRIVAETEAKFQTEKKEKENALLSRENEKKELQLSKKQSLLYILFGVIAVLLFGSLFFYNRYKLKQQKLLNEEILRQEKLRLNAIISTQENERKRISGELHDGLGQMLSAVRINLAAFENKIQLNDENKNKFSGTIELIDDSCKELRNISHNIMPALLINSGLIPALKELAFKINYSTSISVNIEHDENILRLSPEIEINLFRIVQELLNNIIKYSGASEVNISTNESEKHFTLMMEDNGKAFDKNLLENSKGNGWYNINSRLKTMNGKIEIDSKENRGTVVLIDIPIV